MSELSLATCPICHAQDSLSRETMERAGRPFTWYECRDCGSVLLSIGDDQWAYQKVGREAKEYLLKRPMTENELRRLLPSAEMLTTTAAHRGPLSDLERDEAAKASPHNEQERGKPTRLLKVGVAATILVFIGALVFVVAYYHSGGESAPAPSVPSPAFSTGMDVRLVAVVGDSVPIFEIKEQGCSFRFTDSITVQTGERAMILDDICYREKKHDYYYEVESAGMTGWVREGFIMPAELYTPVPTRTPLPTIAPGTPSYVDTYVDRCVGSGLGVKYVVVGEGVSRVSLTWENDTGGTDQGEAGLPVCKTFTGFGGGDFLYISAQIAQGGGDIRCFIYDGMKRIASARASGFASIATCSGSAR